MFCLVTGSTGLIGSQSVQFFIEKGYTIVGIDNDMRKTFFGVSTENIKQSLQATYNNYIHMNVDIRNYDNLELIFQKYKFDCVIHCAAQPSHDWAANEPLTDFGINACGTLNLLELTRKYCKEATFIFMSTNKVYGDTPNDLTKYIRFVTKPLIEKDTRYDVPTLPHGIDESMSIDKCTHSIFGVSKTSADLMVQEYGRYFNMNTVCFRGGCITGKQHCGAELHGFLAYLVKCICKNDNYTIYGYKGKQVRDNIHVYDLVNAFWHFHKNPNKISGSVYNIGGGPKNTISVVEVIQKVNDKIKKTWDKYTIIDKHRQGDHIWYVSDFRKFKNDHPTWDITFNMDSIIDELIVRYDTNE